MQSNETQGHSAGIKRTKNDALLRILCLHGFRQSSESFRGRSAALSRRLEKTASLTFIDAPHELPDIRKTEELDSGEVKSMDFVDNGHTGILQERQIRPRRGWLLTPEQLASESDLLLDKEQYQRQVCGWEESLCIINKELESDTYDGILGLSQGAAVAAAVAALECKRGCPDGRRSFRFVILCSGYVPGVLKLKDLLHSWRERGGVPMPSLHIHGTTGEDRQLGDDDWGALIESFSSQGRDVLEHSRGHFIPCDKDMVENIKRFINLHRRTSATP